jgi:hypothetical protein
LSTLAQGLYCHDLNATEALETIEAPGVPGYEVAVRAVTLLNPIRLAILAANR